MFDSSTREIAVFFHLFPVGAWREIAGEMLDTIEASGLHQHADFVRVGVVQAGQALEVPGHLVRWPWVTIWPVKHRDFEWPTLQLLWDWAQSAAQDALALYVHSKGVTNDHHGCARYWRQMMSYFCIERWAEVEARFEDPMVSAAGPWLRDKQPKPGKRSELKKQGRTWGRLWHFSGNFWWARAGAVRTLPAPDSALAREILTWRGYKRRLQAERWIAGVGGKHMLNLHEPRVNPSAAKYPREAYADNRGS